jgi:hypothetical protein
MCDAEWSRDLCCIGEYRFGRLIATANSYHGRILEGFPPTIFFSLAAHIVQSLHSSEDISSDIALLQSVSSAFQVSFQRTDAGTYCHKISRVLQLLLSNIYALECHLQSPLADLLDDPTPTAVEYLDPLLRLNSSSERKQPHQPQGNLSKGSVTAYQDLRTKAAFPTGTSGSGSPSVLAPNHLQSNSYMQRHREPGEDSARTNTIGDDAYRARQSETRHRSQSIAVEPMPTNLHVDGFFNMHNYETSAFTWPPVD